ncbi:hypothetical protein ACQPX6_03525 [Actinomycetospora sp. CA-101289]|uniref:hypothetical protein n=1 Tax=Actinomycetospora sp. CA-101289 TaxID=3239893 RepID=UPI003D988E08
MTRDLARLATVADELVRSPDRRRLRLLRRYLRGVTAEIVNHHRVEDDDVWPGRWGTGGSARAWRWR